MPFNARVETYVDLGALAAPYDFTLARPTGTVNGDILFTFICISASGVPPTVDSVPASWNLIGTRVVMTNYRFYLYWHIANNDGVSYVWSLTGNTKIHAVCSCYTGGNFDPDDPIDSYSDTEYSLNNATLRAASFNVAAVNSPLFFTGGVAQLSSRTFTKPTVPENDWVEDDDAGSTASGFWSIACSQIWSGSGATGNIDAVISASDTQKHAFAVALNPPPTTGSRALKAKFIVRRSGSQDLKAEFIVSRSESRDLKAEFALAAPNSNDLFAKFFSRQSSSGDLKGLMIIRSSASSELKAEFRVRHSSSIDLAAEATIRHPSSQVLGAILIVRHSANEDLKTISIIRQSVYLGLKAILIIPHSASLNLHAEFTVRQASSRSLDAEATVRQASSRSLDAEATIRHPSSRDLGGAFIVRQSRFVRRRIYAKFEVRQTPAPIELPAALIVARQRTEDLLAVFATSMVNAEPGQLPAEFYVRPRYLIGGGSRVNGQVRAASIRGDEASASIRSSGRASMR